MCDSCKYGTQIEENQQCISNFFQSKSVQGMNEEIHCITNEGEQPEMNGKMMSPTFFELYTVYIKNLDNFFPYFTCYTSFCCKLKIF